MRDGVEDIDRDSLPAAAARAMRERVVAAAREEQRYDAGLWRHPLAFAGTILLLAAAGITTGRWLDASLPASERPPLYDVATDRTIPGGGAARSQRQLQFSTPGGTRIIWVFNSDLDLKAAIP
jgi:hypothetical protein